MTAKLALLAAALGLAAQTNASGLQSDLGRYAAWRGGSAFRSMNSFTERGEIEQGGLRGPFKEWSARDGRQRRHGNLGLIPIDEAVTPTSAWTSNVSGQIEDVADNGKSTRRLLNLGFADAQSAGNARLLGRERREGKSWDVIRYGFGDGDTYDLFVAPATGELLGERVSEDGKTRFVRYSDWRFVSGVRMPFTETTSGSNHSSDESLHLNSIEVNGAIPNGVFARPVEARSWHFADRRRSTGWMAFEFFNDDEIYIPATVNETPVKLLLDSGAGIAVLDSAFAKESGIHAAGSLGVSGTGGQSSMQLAKNFEIKIGGLAFDGLTAGVTDMSAISAAAGHPMPVVLGREAFNELVIDIDFEKRRIAFHDPRNFSPPKNAMRVPLGRHGDKRTVPLVIEGHPPKPFDFDLGNDSPVIVYSPYRDSEHLLDGRPHSLDLVGGVGGINKVAIATLSSLTLAGIRLHNVPVEFPEAGNNAVTYKETAGNAGLPIFTRFRLITDYPHDCLWLVPDTAALAKPFARDRSGLLGQRAGDRWQVLLVAPQSPAAHDGWKEGDEIIAVDGVRMGPHFHDSSAAHWSSKAAGTEVELQLANGSTRILKLADYY